MAGVRTDSGGGFRLRRCESVADSSGHGVKGDYQRFLVDPLLSRSPATKPGAVYECSSRWLLPHAQLHCNGSVARPDCARLHPVNL